MTTPFGRALARIAAALVLSATACGEPEAAFDDGGPFTGHGKSDALAIAEGSPEAAGVLRLVNESSLETLDDDVGLDSRAAVHIVQYRENDARDGQIGTLRELDEIPWVGARAAGKLLSYARTHGWIPAPETNALKEGTTEARGVLRLVNEADQRTLDGPVGLDARAARHIVAARPIHTLAELDAVPWVGPVALEQLLEYARANGWIETACVARTCADSPSGCGSLDDGCGGTIDCGTCEWIPPRPWPSRLQIPGVLRSYARFPSLTSDDDGRCRSLRAWHTQNDENPHTLDLRVDEQGRLQVEGLPAGICEVPAAERRVAQNESLLRNGRAAENTCASTWTYRAAAYVVGDRIVVRARCDWTYPDDLGTGYENLVFEADVR